MSLEARKKLVELVQLVGIEIAGDATRCRALLSHFCGDAYESEVHVLVAAVTERIASELVIGDSLLPREDFYSKLAVRLRDNCGVTEELAHWGVASWALALRVVQPDELAKWEASRRPAVAPELPPSRGGAPTNPSEAVAVDVMDRIGNIEMVILPRGKFVMGSPFAELGNSSSEEPQHTVQIDYALAVGKYPVTFDQWDACVKDGGVSYQPGDIGRGRGSRPVVNVSWNDVQLYLRWLCKVTGKTYRLLSESEWEYAARAGSQTAYSFGDDEKELGRHAWILDDSVYVTHPVGEKPPNAFGLYDMVGNVWQWTEDCWHEDYNGAPANGSAWSTGNGSQRVVRGGSWGYDPQLLRSAYRGWVAAEIRSDDLGFRIARTD